MTKTSVIEVMTQLRDSNFLNKDMFTLSEVAVYTGYEQSYIGKLCRQRKIPYYQSPTGKIQWFDKQEICAWMKSCPVTMENELKAETNNLLNKLSSKTFR